MKSHTRKTLATTLLVQIAALAPLSAQTTWDAGGGGNTSINLNTNWNNDLLPANDGTVSVQFGSSGSIANFNANYFFKDLTLNRTTSFSLNSSGGNITLRSSNSGGTFNLAMSSAATQDMTVNAPVRIDTNNGDANKLFVLRNNNTANSTLDINGDIARSAASSTDFQMRFDGAAGSVTRLDGAISNLTAIQQSGNTWAGTLVFGGSRTMSATNINIAPTGSGVGTPSSTASLVLGESPTDVQTWGSLTLSNSMKLRIGGTVSVGAISVAGNATAAETRILGHSATTASLSIASGTLTANVTVGGAGTNENNLALIKTTTGTLTINGANNTYSGGTTLVDGGASGSFGIALGANNALGSGPLAIGTAATGSNGARLRMAGFNQTVSALSSGATSNARVIENFGTANSTLTVNGASSATYAGFLRDRSTSSATATGNLGLVKDGAGSLILAQTSNQYTGATVINGGVLEVTSLANGGIVKTVTSTAGNATVTMSDTTGITNVMTFVAANLPTGSAVSTVDSGTSLTINTTSGILSGSSTAHFGVASSLGLATNAASNLVFGGGTLRYTGGNASTDRNFTINSGQSAKWDIPNGSTTLTLTGGAASSTGGFEKLGSGTLLLTGTQLYSGNTTVTAGTLQVGAGSDAGSIGSTSAIANSGSLVYNVGNGTRTLNAVISGNGSLTQNSAGGTLTLGGNNTYSGNTTVSAGTLALSGNGTFGTGTVTGSGGTIDLGGKSITNTVGALTGGAQIINGTFTNNSGVYDLQSGTMGTVLSGTNVLTKTGAGTVTLNAANTYTGNTTVSAGTLALGASGSFANSPVINLGTTGSQGTLDLTAKGSAFAFGANQTVSGYGTINIGTGNTVTINGALAPGNSPGITSVIGNLTMAPTTDTTMEIVSRTGAAGTAFDQVSVTGTLTFDGDLFINTTGLTGLIASDSFFLFSAGSYGATGLDSVSISGTVYNPGALTGALGIWTVNDTVNNLTFTFTESNGTLTVTAIPEPSAFAVLGGFGALGLALYHRRRRS